MEATAHADGRHLVGVVGIGRMGAPIAKALSQVFPVGVFDIDATRSDVVPEACWFSSLEGLAAVSDVLITVLPGPAELRACVPTAFVHLRPGGVWIDLTSGDPALTCELAESARSHGVGAVTAPMGGSVTEASAHALVFYVRGQDEDVARALPILEALAAPGGDRRAGERAEDGQIVKLLANGLWFAHALAAAEAMLIGTNLGIGPDRLHDLLRGSAGGSHFLDHHLSSLLDGDYLTTFGIDRVVEELDTITACGTAPLHQHRSSTPLPGFIEPPSNGSALPLGSSSA